MAGNATRRSHHQENRHRLQGPEEACLATPPRRDRRKSDPSTCGADVSASHRISRCEPFHSRCLQHFIGMAPTVILRCVGNAEVLTLAAVAGVVALCIGYGVAIQGEIGRGACPRSSEGDRSATTFLLPSEAATPDRRWSTALWEWWGGR